MKRAVQFHCDCKYLNGFQCIYFKRSGHTRKATANRRCLLSLLPNDKMLWSTSTVNRSHKHTHTNSIYSSHTCKPPEGQIYATVYSIIQYKTHRERTYYVFYDIWYSTSAIYHIEYDDERRCIIICVFMQRVFGRHETDL